MYDSQHCLEKALALSSGASTAYSFLSLFVELLTSVVSRQREKHTKI